MSVMPTFIFTSNIFMGLKIDAFWVIQEKLHLWADILDFGGHPLWILRGTRYFWIKWGLKSMCTNFHACIRNWTIRVIICSTNLQQCWFWRLKLRGHFLSSFLYCSIISWRCQGYFPSSRLLCSHTSRQWPTCLQCASWHSTECSSSYFLQPFCNYVIVYISHWLFLHRSLYLSIFL